MKKIIFCFLAIGVLNSCSSISTNTEEIDDEVSQDEHVLTQEDVFMSNQWDEFRFGVLNDPSYSSDEEFDMLKHYDPEKVSHSIADLFLDDDFTRETLRNTEYKDLQWEIFDGVSAAAMYAIMASDDIMIGTIYYFAFTSYGLQLIGTMPY